MALYTPKRPQEWVLGKITASLALNDDGVLVWAQPTAPNTRVGERAGSLDRKGYVYVTFQKDGEQRRLAAHHIVWFMKTGEWPAQEINHINGVASDNRFENLELSNRLHQMWSARPAGNAVGQTGVEKINGGKYRARIRINGVTRHLGVFESPRDAHLAYVAAFQETRGGRLPRTPKEKAA